MATSTQLQRKIFSRWCNQKLACRNIVVNDIVTDIGDGVILINLLEVLGEREFPEKYNKAPKLRVHKIENLNKGLSFVWSSGVVMKVKASAEDLADGVEIQVLGLIWGIMLKFLKFGDDAEALNAKDALLLWVQNKTIGYANLKVENFKKSFKDGLALCAIIHKHRPNLLNYDALSPSAAVANIKTAMNAAETYFQLEQYLTPEEYQQLDENSMVVYVAEYYYGIADQRKVDLAVRRVQKLVALTVENDRMRSEHNAGALRLRDHITKVEKILEDRTIDNTMEGAKRRIAEFYEYKTKDKGIILADQLSLEALYNNLAMRLAHHKRPEYVPPEGCALKDVAASVAHLEECEQERNVALHQELNRQIKLVRWDNRHKDITAKLQAWSADKEAYLNTKEIITSVGAAQYQLSRLDAYDQESKQVETTTFASLRKLGDDLDGEKYESISGTRAREQELADTFVRLGQLSVAKRPVLEDDLAREQFRDDLRLQNQEHIDIFANLEAWIADKEAYLNTKEAIDSVAQAQVQLSLLESYEAEKQMAADSNVAQLKALGADIQNARYQTQYSSAQWETPAEIDQRHAGVDAKWAELSQLSAAKKAVLEDDLAREIFKANLRVLNTNHNDKSAKLQAWIAEKEAYLNTKEAIDSVAQAQLQLSLLDAYERDKATLTTTNVAALKALGAEIRGARYETQYSSASWSSMNETPAQVDEREAAVDAKWAELSQLSAAKKEVLDDDLAREQFRDKLRTWNHNHQSAFGRLQAWVALKKDYLNKVEDIDTVSGAQVQLKLLAAYGKDKQLKATTLVAALKKLGAELLDARYHTKFSAAQWESPSDVTSREAAVDADWAELSRLSDAKNATLEADLAREIKKEELRVRFAGLAGDFSRWARETADTAASSQFGFDLPEVEAYQAELDRSDAAVATDADSYRERYSSVHAEAVALGVRENVYTDATPDSLAGVRATLDAALAARRDAYQAELAVQRANDALCKSFADVADPLSHWITDQKDTITKSKDDLEPQLTYVLQRLSTTEADSASLAQIRALQAEIDAKAITNRHTLLTARDVEVQWQQYEAFLARKKQMLEEAIEHHKLRGITPEQYREIEANFAQFDKNSNGRLEPKELKACLYSLGEERGAKDITSIVERYGANGVIEYEGFKEFMISLLGDTDTKEEIINSFRLINRADVIVQERLDIVSVPPEVQQYLRDTAPQAEGGWNYHAWTDAVFSR